MTDLERYLFDLNGFLVVRGVFTEDEIAAANAAVDARAEPSSSARATSVSAASSGDPLAGDGVDRPSRLRRDARLA